MVVAVAHQDGVDHGAAAAEEEAAVEVVVEAVAVAGASEGLIQMAIHCELAMGFGNRIWEAHKHRVEWLHSNPQPKIDV